MRKIRILGILLFSISLFSCKSQQEDTNAAAHSVHVDTFMARRMEAELVDFRNRKNEQFKTASDSPIPAELRPGFVSLEYYPVNWKYRFEGLVNRYPTAQRFEMIATNGEKRQAEKYGYIRFFLDGKEIKLQVYKLLDTGQDNLLFVPFTDVNAGKETYGAGRYIDLVEKPDGRYVIDFNSAYNPYCAYGGKFPCPVTPEENRLKVAIPAGEKVLPLAAALEASRKRSQPS